MVDSKLNELILQKQRELEVMYDELGSIPGGALNIRNKMGSYYFMERVGHEQRGITKDKERVKKLARKTFLTEKIRIYEQELETLKGAYDQIAAIDRGRIDRVREWLLPIGNTEFNYSEKELGWIRNRMSKNPLKREFLRFETNGGVLTRSKSERYIGNFLEEKSLIYMYEAEIELDGYLMHPDFTILCPDGRIVIWEHCGMMDKVGYYLRTMVRAYDYRKIGYVQHDNLIFTYDEDLDNIETLEKIYRRFLI